MPSIYDMKEDVVTIIVPVYNVEDYLSRCIESVIAQSYNCWELILVDDGSPDNCPQICDNYSSLDGRIKVIHQINKGQASARNAGLDVAKGDLIMFLDSDDFLHKDALRDSLAVLKKTNADIVQFSFIKGNDNIFPNLKVREKIKFFNRYTILTSNVQSIVVWGKLYKRYLWENVKMPEGKMNFEDDATTWKVYEKSETIAFLDVPYYYYTQNPNSTMANQKKAMSMSFINAYEERINYFEDKGDILMAKLSKWRFCLPLMLGYMFGNISKDNLGIVLIHFRRIYKEVVFCKDVPFMHRVLISLFSICPHFWRSLFSLVGKSHAIG